MSLPEPGLTIGIEEEYSSWTRKPVIWRPIRHRSS